MTAGELLIIVKQKIGQAIAEIGGDNPEFLDSQLLQYVNTINFELEILGVATSLVIDSSAETITPDPSNKIGYILAVGTASILISDDLVGRLKRGEMGLSFSSGGTQITTNQAAITLSSASRQLRNDYRVALTAYLSDDPNSEIERLQ